MIAALPLVLQRVPEVKWVVIGDGRLRPELERAVAEQGLNGCVEFAGYVSDSERDQWLERARAFAMPSRIPPGGEGEGFGIVYLEAAAHGVPVVAGNAAGAVDAIVHGRTGLLVDPEDASGVAEALVRILEDDALASRLSDEAVRRVGGFSWTATSRRIEDELLASIREHAHGAAHADDA
jgi:phosphatidylinositol alpha-1,6-mannosyltransferase